MYSSLVFRSRGIEHGVLATGRCCRALPALSLVLFIASCGGGGGGGGGPPAVSMSVSTTQISATASLTDAPPTASLTVTINNPDSGKNYYIGYSATNTVIDTVDIMQAPGFTATVQIKFKPPGQLGPATFTETLLLGVCLDAQCATQISGSPKSVTVTYTVTQAVPVLNAVNPAAISAGGSAFELTLIGAGFWTGSTVLWNGADRPTSYVSASEIIANISAADITAIGMATVAVTNPGPPSLTSNSMSVSIVAPTKDAVAFQIDALHSGHIQFASASLPSAPKWTVTFSGSPGYPLIAAGKVFVTVPDAFGSSSEFALDQATGGTAWGPIALSGAAGAAYENGRLFVLDTPNDLHGLSSGRMQAFDPASGQLLWSATLAGQYFFTSPPTAANGLVYAVGAGTGVTVYAVDEATGVIVWSSDVGVGAASVPAVSVDGLFVSGDCDTYELRPGTGTQIWHYNASCSGGSGQTSILANGLLYGTAASSIDSGTIFDAATGAISGTYTAASPPAFDGARGYFVQQTGTLTAANLTDNSPLWSFAGDGQIDSAPIVVNQYVFVGSYTGRLYALDSAAGTELWHMDLGAPVFPSPLKNAMMPVRGLAAGNGLLIVPAGNTLTAFELSNAP